MVTIKEVRTKKEQREFLEFPNRLYRGNPCFVPALYGDEKKIFNKNYVYHDTCEDVFFLAEEDGKTLGRISGILQKASNELRKEKRVRFTRFDAVNRQDVADALFRAVEQWGKEKGMDTLVGPLGYSDLEREGLLVEGFDRLATYEEWYNADYYPALLEHYGFQKEADWTESMITPSETDTETLSKMSDLIQKRYHLHLAKETGTKRFLKKYADDMIALIDTGYEDLYSTVPFTPGMKEMLIKNFTLLLDMRFVMILLDEQEKPVCFGLCLPSIAKAVQKSEGRLTPGCIYRILKSKQNPEIIDLALVAVTKEYLNRGVPIVICAEMEKMLKKPGISHAETNLNLEDNAGIQNLWKRFTNTRHKRRRSYVKEIH